MKKLYVLKIYNKEMEIEDINIGYTEEDLIRLQSLQHLEVTIHSTYEDDGGIY